MNLKGTETEVKILIVNKFLYANGGSETYIFQIGKQLKQMGNEVQYFGMEHKDRLVGNRTSSYTSDMDFHTGKLKKMMYPFKILYSIEARKKIRIVLDDFAPDVVHLNNINFQITPSIIDEIVKYRKEKNKVVKIVYTAHDYQWVCPNHMLMIPSSRKLCTKCVDGDYLNCVKNNCIHNSKIRSVLAALEAQIYNSRGTYEFVDKIICPSAFMQKMLQHNRHLQNKFIVLHNYTNTEHEAENNDTKENFILPNEYVLYFGRYDEQKGISTLLNSCRKLPEIQFVFAGSGPLKDEIRSLSNIKEIGFVKGIVLENLIRHALFTVFPSEWYENCPFSVIESLTKRTPVIASDLGGTPELLDDKVTGELFPPGNDECLAEIISALWNDRKKVEKYRENCERKLSESNSYFLTLHRYCEQLVKIYSE